MSEINNIGKNMYPVGDVFANDFQFTLSNDYNLPRGVNALYKVDTTTRIWSEVDILTGDDTFKQSKDGCATRYKVGVKDLNIEDSKGPSWRRLSHNACSKDVELCLLKRRIGVHSCFFIEGDRSSDFFVFALRGGFQETQTNRTSKSSKTIMNLNGLILPEFHSHMDTYLDYVYYHDDLVSKALEKYSTCDGIGLYYIATMMQCWMLKAKMAKFVVAKLKTMDAMKEALMMSLRYAPMLNELTKSICHELAFHFSTLDASFLLGLPCATLSCILTSFNLKSQDHRKQTQLVATKIKNYLQKLVVEDANDSNEMIDLPSIATLLSSVNVWCNDSLNSLVQFYNTFCESVKLHMNEAQLQSQSQLNGLMAIEDAMAQGICNSLCRPFLGSTLSTLVLSEFEERRENTTLERLSKLRTEYIDKSRHDLCTGGSAHVVTELNGTDMVSLPIYKVVLLAGKRWKTKMLTNAVVSPTTAEVWMEGDEIRYNINPGGSFFVQKHADRSIHNGPFHLFYFTEALMKERSLILKSGNEDRNPNNTPLSEYSDAEFKSPAHMFEVVTWAVNETYEEESETTVLSPYDEIMFSQFLSLIEKDPKAAFIVLEAAARQHWSEHHAKALRDMDPVCMSKFLTSPSVCVRRPLCTSRLVSLLLPVLPNDVSLLFHSALSWEKKLTSVSAEDVSTLENRNDKTQQLNRMTCDYEYHGESNDENGSSTIRSDVIVNAVTVNDCPLNETQCYSYNESIAAEVALTAEYRLLQENADHPVGVVECSSIPENDVKFTFTKKDADELSSEYLKTVDKSRCVIEDIKQASCEEIQTDTIETEQINEQETAGVTLLQNDCQSDKEPLHTLLHNSLYFAPPSSSRRASDDEFEITEQHKVEKEEQQKQQKQQEEQEEEQQDGRDSVECCPNLTLSEKLSMAAATIPSINRPKVQVNSKQIVVQRTSLNAQQSVLSSSHSLNKLIRDGRKVFVKSAYSLMNGQPVTSSSSSSSFVSSQTGSPATLKKPHDPLSAATVSMATKLKSVYGTSIGPVPSLLRLTTTLSPMDALQLATHDACHAVSQLSDAMRVRVFDCIAEHFTQYCEADLLKLSPSTLMSVFQSSSFNVNQKVAEKFALLYLKNFHAVTTPLATEIFQVANEVTAKFAEVGALPPLAPSTRLVPAQRDRFLRDNSINIASGGVIKKSLHSSAIISNYNANSSLGMSPLAFKVLSNKILTLPEDEETIALLRHMALAHGCSDLFLKCLKESKSETFGSAVNSMGQTSSATEQPHTSSFEYSLLPDVA